MASAMARRRASRSTCLGTALLPLGRPAAGRADRRQKSILPCACMGKRRPGLQCGCITNPAGPRAGRDDPERSTDMAVQTEYTHNKDVTIAYETFGDLASGEP